MKIESEFKLEYNKKLRTICIRFKDKLFYPQAQETCCHKTLHIEGKYLKFLVCNGCGKKWEREVEYSKNTRYTFFRLTPTKTKEMFEHFHCPEGGNPLQPKEHCEY